MYNKDRIKHGTGAALGVWAVIGLLVVSTGVVFALPLAGVGGFVVEADSISGTQLQLYPGVSDTTNRDAYPMSVIELSGSWTVTNLRLSKEIEFNGFAGLPGTARIVVESDGATTLDNTLLKTSALNASNGASFEDFSIDERNTDDPTGQFLIRANESVQLTDANIRAHYLLSQSVTLSSMELSVQYDPDNDGDYEVS